MPAWRNIDADYDKREHALCNSSVVVGGRYVVALVKVNGGTVQQ